MRQENLENAILSTQMARKDDIGHDQCKDD